ncbi:hypothetical protein ACR0H0_003428 [Escherichia coli O21,81:H5,27]|nr:hypothetical protein [Escherichia coli]ELO5007803.1 hypothetical protein [Escherichia coli]MBY7345438.1 hypothetical protein [Escherichia coli]MCA8591990.1 hypothetical protein [Escherichia coli]MCA8597601.1 hypothetical protein [Escherichia coli]MCA8621276.1 hypothetical protein [Escherichia coli]
MDYSEFKEHFSILSDTRQARKSTYNFFEVMFQQGKIMNMPVFKGFVA